MGYAAHQPHVSVEKAQLIHFCQHSNAFLSKGPYVLLEKKKKAFIFGKLVENVDSMAGVGFFCKKKNVFLTKELTTFGQKSAVFFCQQNPIFLTKKPYMFGQKSPYIHTFFHQKNPIFLHKEPYTFGQKSPIFFEVSRG